MSFDDVDNRSELRSLGVVQAFVSDPADLINIKCSIRDLSPGGCRIVTRHIRDLPDLVQLTPEGFSKPISAMIVWRLGKMAGLLFEHAAGAEGKVRFENLRAVRRREDKRLRLDSQREPGSLTHTALSFADRLKIWRSLRLSE